MVAEKIGRWRDTGVDVGVNINIFSHYPIFISFDGCALELLKNSFTFLIA